MKKLFKIIIFILIILFIFFYTHTNIYYIFRSYIVMYPYSLKEKSESILSKKKLKLHIPGGLYTKERDWYPFMMTFNDNEGFSKYVGKDLSLTVLYNFGYFEKEYGSSSYYNPSSPFYSSFYGAYVVSNNKNPKEKFGFYKNGELNISELSLVPKYDQTRLVLPSIGCPRDKIVFKTQIDKIEYNVKYVGESNWVKIDSTIKTNSPIHKAKKDCLGYIQYGKPIEKYYNQEEYPIITLKGRMYAKYIEEYNVTIAFYILAPNISTINKYDDKVLSKSQIIK
ncbi:hypothetical protein [Caldisalinibacter kiritimatiensis]|uniref:Uncharacterized protein n=1 Tax=Caldisalinibacter kiritimatiensis TaxID=1304284 RepID=R1CR98_9FIRM|nr:hypothetical protein [Caldisalinibacter kiritimatiensis]EOC99238.1 hypothetical protein L21TH_2702 [Caldisalinibacter kiritimatiensis]